MVISKLHPIIFEICFKLTTRTKSEPAPVRGFDEYGLKG